MPNRQDFVIKGCALVSLATGVRARSLPALREGFGLTVTEAMWKGKPVIGGNTGGSRLQVVNHHTGFLVSTPEGAALRVRYLHQHQELREQMGIKAREFVRQNFLLTRQLRDYLAVMTGLLHPGEERIAFA